MSKNFALGPKNLILCPEFCPPIKYNGKWGPWLPQTKDFGLGQQNSLLRVRILSTPYRTYFPVLSYLPRFDEVCLHVKILRCLILIVCSYISSRQRPPPARREETYMYGRSRRYSDFRDEPTAATPLQPGKENPNVGTLPLVKQHSYRHNHPHSGLPSNIRENVYMESRPLPSIPDLNEVDNDDAKSDRSSQNKVQVYRTSSGKEHYHNPRLVVNMRSDRSDRSDHSDPRGPSEDPQYFVLDPDEVSTGNPASPLPGASGCSASSHHQHQHHHHHPSHYPHQQHYPGARAGGGGGGGAAAGGVPSDKQKSPEEENAENFNKEVASTNSSLPELPPRPVTGLPRQMSHRVQSNPNEYSQGNSNSSWPWSVCTSWLCVHWRDFVAFHLKNASIWILGCTIQYICHSSGSRGAKGAISPLLCKSSHKNYSRRTWLFICHAPLPPLWSFWIHYCVSTPLLKVHLQYSPKTW